MTTPASDSTIFTTPSMSLEFNQTSGEFELITDCDEDRSGVATSSSSMHGATILSSTNGSSSAPSLSLTNSDDNSMVHVPIDNNASLSLSINPSMIDSSILLQQSEHHHYRSDVSSQSSMTFTSASDISSIVSSSDSTTTLESNISSPEYLFANIGRSLMLASASAAATATSLSNDDLYIHHDSDSESQSKKSTESCECDSVPNQAPTGKEEDAIETREGTRVKKKWWDTLKTEQDWDNFRAKAKESLNALVAEEVKTMNHNYDTGTSPGGHSKVRQWFQGLYNALSAVGTTTPQTTTLSSLVKEVAEIKQQLDRLPPPPPSLPEDLPLNDLPNESRDKLLQYRTNLNAWREEAMPQHEALAVKYEQCQEMLLAAIIDTEEKLFYERNNNDGGDGNIRGCGSYNNKNVLGTINEDGYIGVVGKDSVKWDVIYEEHEEVIASQGKCQLSLRNTLVMALTAGVAWGATIFLNLQPKQR